MSDPEIMIRRDIEDDIGIRVKALAIEVFTKGFIPRRKFLKLSGIAHTAHDRDRAEQIAHHHCGDAITVVDEIEVEEQPVS